MATRASLKHSRTLPLIAAVAALCAVVALDLLADRRANIDFKSFYLAAQAARRGADMYAIQALNELAARLRVEGPIWPYIYPPFLAYVLTPLASLRLFPAQLLWAAASLVAAGVALSLSLRGFAPRASAAAGSGGEPVVPLQVAVALAALLVSVLPLRANVAHGQVNLVVLALVVLSLRSHLRGGDVASGALLGVATLIKVTPAIFALFFLARRRLKAALACALSVLLLAAATLALGALPAWEAFFDRLPQMTYGAHIEGLFEPGVVWNFSPAGLLSRSFPGRLLLIRALSAAVAAALVGTAAWFAWRARQPEAVRLSLALFFPALVLVSPLVYVHHVVYLAPAAAVWLDRAWRDRRPWLLAALVLLIAVASADLPPLYDRLRLGAAFRFVTSLNLYALLALVGVGIYLQRGEGR